MIEQNSKENRKRAKTEKRNRKNKNKTVVGKDFGKKRKEAKQSNEMKDREEGSSKSRIKARWQVMKKGVAQAGALRGQRSANGPR